jgi:hypothetical protein
VLVDDLIISGSEPVSPEAIGGVCRQLPELGLIQWTGYVGHGPRIGSARMTANGSSAVEQGAWAGVNIQFPGRVPDHAKKEFGLRRDPQLIQKLLDKLEAYPSEYGDVFTLNGDDPLLAVDGFTSDQINYHLEQLRETGYLDSPGSQPRIGLTFAGLSPSGHDFLDRSRAKTPLSPTSAVTQAVSNKVFVVHGRDDAAKNEVALFLRALALSRSSFTSGQMAAVGYSRNSPKSLRAQVSQWY